MKKILAALRALWELKNCRCPACRQNIIRSYRAMKEIEKQRAYLKAHPWAK